MSDQLSGDKPAVTAGGSGGGRRLAITAAVVGGLVVLGVAVGVLAGGGDGGSGGAADPDGAAPPTSGPTDGDVSDDLSGDQELHTVGQTVRTGGFDVTVHAVQDPFVSSHQFDAPAEGQRFVAVEATIANTTDRPLPFSSLGGAELRDGTGRTWPAVLAGIDLPRLDAASVRPGEAHRGWVVFSAPLDATELTIRIRGDLTGASSAFALT